MKKTILLTSIALALSACTSVNTISENWINYSSGNISTAQLAENQSLAVFYRTAEFQGPAVNVYVNGDYQVSLLEKGYSAIALCTKEQLITASYTHEGFGNRTKGSIHNLPEKQIAYFRAANKAGEVIFERVDAHTAQSEINDLTGKVSHGLSRVVNPASCR